MDLLRQFSDSHVLAAFRVWLEWSAQGRLVYFLGCTCSHTRKPWFCMGHVVYKESFWPTVEVEM
jgi:hypothetical protein